MNFSNPLLILIISVCFFSCQTNDSNQESAELKNHLSTSLVDNPRSLKDDSLALSELGKMVFTDTLHDFGKIAEGEIVEYDFEFENKGKKDILISDAKASCGCTVPSYPKQPVKNGEKETIKITFNSQGKKGFNEKMIIVTTNGNPSVYNIYIRAEVTGK